VLNREHPGRCSSCVTRRLLGVSSATVYKLPHTRILSAIRIVAADLAAFVIARRATRDQPTPLIADAVGQAQRYVPHTAQPGPRDGGELGLGLGRQTRSGLADHQELRSRPSRCRRTGASRCHDRWRSARCAGAPRRYRQLSPRYKRGSRDIHGLALNRGLEQRIQHGVRRQIHARREDLLERCPPHRP